MLEALPAAIIMDALLEALEIAGIGCTVIMNRSGRPERVYSNSVLTKIFGRDIGPVFINNPLDLVPKEDHARFESVRASLEEESRGVRTFDARIIRVDGVPVPIEVGLAFLPIDGGRLTFAFVRDISERERMEAALRESEERFRKVTEVSPDAIAIVADNKIIYANPATLRVLGLSSVAQLDGVDPMMFVTPAQRAAVAARYVNARKCGTVGPFEFRATGPDGREHIFESSMSLTSMNGRPATISYAREVTERIELHAELMKQDRLASVGMLAAGVAHELNNPLTSLALQTRKLVENGERLGLPEPVREHLEQMDEAVKRMREILGDLIFLARPAEQPQAHVDIGRILTSTMALLRAGAAEIAVDFEIDTVPPVYGFASKLGQVFLNVLRNAAQAIDGVPEGKIRVRCARDGEFVQVTVADNGPGMSATHLERVAQPFFTTKPQGMGLGLWISKTVMRDHGGTLDIASTEGTGTVVTLRVPLRVAS